MRKKIKRLRAIRTEVITKPKGPFVLTTLDGVRNKFKLPLTENTELTTSTLVSIIGTCKIAVGDGRGKMILNRIIIPHIKLGRRKLSEEDVYYVNKDVHLETIYNRITNTYDNLLKRESNTSIKGGKR